MKHISFRLENYLGMPKLNPEVFEHTFDDRNVILVKGGNGSGKSRLLNQMTPMPPDKKDFGENGYKEQVITHKGNDYILTADFRGKSPVYGFNKNNEQLNLSGIVSAQKELVKSEFGINATIHDIMVGREKFTKMTLLARKKLFKALTRINIDNVLKGYAEIMNQLNFNVRLLKSETTQFKLEEVKLLDSEDLKEKEGRLGETIRARDKLIEVRNGLSRFISIESNGESLQDLDFFMANLDALINDNIYYLTSYPKASIEKERDEVNESLSDIDIKLNTLYINLTRLEEIRSNIIHSHDGYDGDIMGFIERKTKERDDYMNDICCFDITINENTLNVVFSKLYHNLAELIEGMEPNPQIEGEGHFFRTDKLNQYEDIVSTLRKEHVECKSLRYSITERRDHLCGFDDEVKCPNCNTSITISALISNDDDIKTRIEKLKAREKEIEAEVEEKTEYIQRCRSYFRSYSMISKLSHESLTYFREFWSSVMFNVVNNPSDIISDLNLLNGDVNSFNLAKAIDKELNLAKDKLVLAESVNKYSLEDITIEKEFIEEEITLLQGQEDKLRQKLMDINYTDKLHDKLEIDNRVIERTKDRVRSHNLSRLASSIINTLDTKISELRLQEYEYSKAIHDNDFIKKSIDKMQAKIDDIKETIEVLTLVSEKVSPKDGIIAKTISSFLNGIIKGVNSVIARVWSYDMELVPIDIGNESLNYKFKLFVMGKPNVDDISIASTGMQEVINYSFVYVVYKLLGLNHYPLILDELASAMDKTHTDRMLHMIHDLSTDNEFSQIFIANHKENMSFIKDVDVINVD